MQEKLQPSQAKIRRKRRSNRIENIFRISNEHFKLHFKSIGKVATVIEIHFL